jgi:16S rRNA (guanine(966)-N(2))-methyltransferase RsmD
LRIIGGKYKGRIIDPVAGLKARPTTDFAKESLFNIFTNRIDFETASVLDLFSGTGSISFEFASRGAEIIHSVEKDSKHVYGIKKGIEKLKAENIKVIHIDVKTYLKTCKFKYDIVFADPPYDLTWLTDLPDFVIESGVLKEEATFILDHPKNLSFTGHKYFSEHRNYGNVNFSFFSSGSNGD